jgi:hypothetical protein
MRWRHQGLKEKINEYGYLPTIIQNPFDEILSNSDWEKEVEKYFVYKA